MNRHKSLSIKKKAILGTTTYLYRASNSYILLAICKLIAMLWSILVSLAILLCAIIRFAFDVLQSIGESIIIIYRMASYTLCIVSSLLVHHQGLYQPIAQKATQRKQKTHSRTRFRRHTHQFHIL